MFKKKIRKDVKRVLINAECNEVRVAIMDKRLEEFFIERSDEQSYVGNIYKGCVQSVIPGIQSAFVDIGLEKNGFLYVTDVKTHESDGQRYREDSDSEGELVIRPQGKVPIEKSLSVGDEILVQVEKDPISTKGVRLTTYISIPGQYLVLMPFIRQRGVSKRISTQEEREFLLETLNDLSFLNNLGCVVRTAAEGQERKRIISDAKNLYRIWTKILRKEKRVSAPSVLHEERDLIERVVRDSFREDIDEMIVDDEDVYKKVKTFVRSNMPDYLSKIKLYRGSEPLFYAYHVERELQRVYRKKVPLKCGGYLVIEQTEALVTIDVNTGKNVGKGNFEKTVFETNMEAAIEIPRQLRLRAMGGIIIIDFIDMKDKDNRKKVYNTLSKEVKKDKTKTNILQISKMGLIEMTRQRTGHGVFKKLHEECPHCEGSGHIKSTTSIALDIIRKLKLIFIRSQEKNILLYIHPQIYDRIMSNYRAYVLEIEKRFGRHVDMRKDPDLLIWQVRIFRLSTKEELEFREILAL